MSRTSPGPLWAAGTWGEHAMFRRTFRDLSRTFCEPFANVTRSEVYSTYGYIPTGGSRDHRQITFRSCRSLADHLQILDLVDSWIASCSLACRSAIKGSVVETCALIGREIVRASGRSCEIATTFNGHSLQQRSTRCLEALSQLCDGH